MLTVGPFDATTVKHKPDKYRSLLKNVTVRESFGVFRQGEHLPKVKVLWDRCLFLAPDGRCQPFHLVLTTFEQQERPPHAPRKHRARPV